jgi:sugar O-acyltransferase (sialic acid O-acetyltransferase NeuD family)
VRDLIIAGAGGFARETAAAVRAGSGWRLLGFLDDDPALHGQVRSGLPVLDELSAARGMDASVVVCVGNPRDYAARARVVRRLDLPPDRYATVVHPSAEVGAGCVVGPGSVLLAGAVLTADVTVGAHVAVMPQAVLTHDDVVADFVTLASGVRLGGGVLLAAGSYIGAGALIRESVTIGAGALVGLGSVVLRDVPPGQVWAGNPARYLREAPVQVMTQPATQGRARP